MDRCDRLPQKGKKEESVLREIQQYCNQNYAYKSMHILNSICSEPLPIAKEAFLMASDTNLGDKRLFPGAVELEQRLIRMLGTLFHNSQVAGSLVSGGTEGNILAMLVARQKKMNIKAPEIIVPKSIHFSVIKAAKLLGIKLIMTETDENFRAIPMDIQCNITENTIAIFVTAGTSETGAIDPIGEINEICKRNNLYLHVDAASGGLIIPFAEMIGEKMPIFDFRLDAVMSITVDPHKYGFSVIPSGVILFRNVIIQDYINFESFFWGTPNHRTLLGTRSAAGAASAYAVMKYWGKDGFINVVKYLFCLKKALLNLLSNKSMDTIGVADLNIILIKCSEPVDIMKKLESLGWYVSVSKNLKALRIVLNLHNTIEELEEFVDVLAQLNSV